MAAISLLLVCMSLGVVARRSRLLPENSHVAVNAWVLWISLPALVLRSIHDVRWSWDMALATCGMWLVFGVAAAAGWFAVRRGASRERIGALVLGAGLGNTAFVGLPLVEALGGPQAVSPAIVLDQLGSFVALSFFAVPFAAWLSGVRSSKADLLRRVATFPPLVALVLAVLLQPVVLPTVVDVVLARLGDMMSPLALASVGWQLDFGGLRAQLRPLATGLVFKLVCAPALMLGLLWAASPTMGLIERVAVAQAGMAPMVTGGVLAAQYNLEPRLGAGLIALGVFLSLVTVPLWWEIAGLLAA